MTTWHLITDRRGKVRHQHGRTPGDLLRAAVEAASAVHSEAAVRQIIDDALKAIDREAEVDLGGVSEALCGES